MNKGVENVELARGSLRPTYQVETAYMTAEQSHASNQHTAIPPGLRLSCFAFCGASLPSKPETPNKQPLISFLLNPQLAMTALLIPRFSGLENRLDWGQKDQRCQDHQGPQGIGALGRSAYTLPKGRGGGHSGL